MGCWSFPPQSRVWSGVERLRIFVLNTGRCGSHTFAQACNHIENFTAAHESRTHQLGDERLNYPDNHIEVDNRLAWFLGRLHQQFPTACYVHLKRDPDQVARSYANRWVQSPPSHEAGKLAQVRMHLGLGGAGLRSRITTAYGYSIIVRHDPWPTGAVLDVCRDYVDTVNANITEFLRDKPHLPVRLEKSRHDFGEFWDWIDAVGDRDAALAEWSVAHDSGAPRRRKIQLKSRRRARLRWESDAEGTS